MSKTPKTTKTTADTASTRTRSSASSLADLLQSRTRMSNFTVWLCGQTPLICHAWSQKAKLSMLAKQQKQATGGREAKDPQQDFIDTLYRLPDSNYGFPGMAIKNALVDAAHKDKGIAKTTVRAALYLKATMIRTYTAHSDAICDLPLIRLYGSQPEMREDMVRVGSGVNKIATLVYRAQFTVWAMRVEGQLNETAIPRDALRYLLDTAGLQNGIGEWRNERGGMFGAFHVADIDEEKAWEAFAKGGKLPEPAEAMV